MQRTFYQIFLIIYKRLAQLKLLIQQQQINQKPFHKRIWVLDNQYCDETAKEKTRLLLSQGEKCFIWPEELLNYKDFNDLCVQIDRDEITPQFIIKNSYTELKGKLLLSKI